MRSLIVTLIAVSALSLGANTQVHPSRVQRSEPTPGARHVAPQPVPSPRERTPSNGAQFPSHADDSIATYLPQLMPDLEALPFAVNGTNNGTSAHPPGIGELPQTFSVRNNGGKPAVGFAFRLSCRVKAKEFDLGPCLYTNYQDAVNHTGAAENADLFGIAYLPGPGETIQASYVQDFWVNCREDMGGRCTVGFEPDFQHDVAESNESNNKYTVFFD